MQWINNAGFLILLGIAAALIGFAAYQVFSENNETEAVDLSEQIGRAHV